MTGVWIELFALLDFGSTGFARRYCNEVIMKKIFFVLGFELGRPFIGPPAMPHVARWVRAHDEGLRAAGCGAEEKVGFGSSRRCRTGGGRQRSHDSTRRGDRAD